jgi:hypothetical protein
VCCIILAKLLLLKFHKIPFACTYTASKDRIMVMIVLGLIGFYVFSTANAAREVALLRDPIRFLLVVPWFALFLWWIHHYRSELPRSERILVFEDRPLPAMQVLNLSK